MAQLSTAAVVVHVGRSMQQQTTPGVATTSWVLPRPATLWLPASFVRGASSISGESSFECGGVCSCCVPRRLL